MKTKSFRAVRSAALAAASAAGVLFVLPPAASAAVTPTLSPAVSTQLVAAQNASQKKDFQGALAAVEKAKALPNTTPYDQYKINVFLTFVDANLGDEAGADVAAEAAAESPAMPDTEKVTVLRNALVLAIQSKHFDKAKVYAKGMQDAGATDDKSLASIMQGYYAAGDYANAEAVAQKAIDATPPGQKPDYHTLELLMSAQVQQKNEDAAEKTLELTVTTYNDPKDWSQLIQLAFGTKGLRDIDALYLGRLMIAVGGSISDTYANIIATNASHLTFYGDAQAAVAKGATPLPDVDAKAAADQKSMAAQIAAGDKQNGQYNVKLAEALYGYGRYPEAEAAANKAIAKGGATDPSEPPMVLGMTLVAEGRYSDAINAFNQVTGGGPATPRVVRMWKEFAQSKATPAPTASAASPPAPAAAP